MNALHAHAHRAAFRPRYLSLTQSLIIIIKEKLIETVSSEARGTSMPRLGTVADEKRIPASFP